MGRGDLGATRSSGGGSPFIPAMRRYAKKAQSRFTAERAEAPVESRKGAVSHAFQKTARKGIKTPQDDIDLIKRRMRVAEQDHEAQTRGTS